MKQHGFPGKAFVGRFLALLLIPGAGFAEETDLETAYKNCVEINIKSLAGTGNKINPETAAKNAETSCGLITVNCTEDRKGEACQDMLKDYLKPAAEPVAEASGQPVNDEEKFIYHFARNPYKSYLEEEAERQENEARKQAAIIQEQQVATTVQRVKEPLEKFELDSLKLSATIERSGAFFAMIRDPRKRGHIIREGNYIGTHDGRVQEIDYGKVVIIEPSMDLKDPNKTRTIILELPKDKDKDEFSKLTYSSSGADSATPEGPLPEGLLPKENSAAPAKPATPEQKTGKQ